MSPYLYSLLVVLQALQALTTPSTTLLTTCNKGGSQDVAVDGWPVKAALRIPHRATVTMNLSLSNDHVVHTNLTLAYQLVKDVGVLLVTLESRMVRSKMSTATHLPDSSWSTLSIFVHRKKELEIRVESEQSVKYSSSAWVNTTHQEDVNKVSCSGSSCTAFVNLNCLYSNSKSNQTKPHKPSSNMSTSDKRVYYWVFYVVVSLLVVACLLFLVWRNEQKKFRTRWWRHSQNVRRITSATEHGDNSCQADGTTQTAEWRASTTIGHSNPAYNVAGDSD